MVSALRDVPVPAQSPRPSRSRASNKSELATCPVPRLRPAAECRSAVTLLDVLEVVAVDDPDLAADKSAGSAMAPAVPRSQAGEQSGVQGIPVHHQRAAVLDLRLFQAPFCSIYPLSLPGMAGLQPICPAAQQIQLSLQVSQPLLVSFCVLRLLIFLLVADEIADLTLNGLGHVAAGSLDSRY